MFAVSVNRIPPYMEPLSFKPRTMREVIDEKSGV
jgi:hypothetical protein